MTRPRRTKFDPAIHRVPLEKVTIFEITDAELESLERGSPESLFLNLAIASFSISFSFLVSLLTATITDIRTFCVFVIVCTIGLITGVTFGLLWWQSHHSLQNVAREIRKRMPPEGIQENNAEEN